MAIQQILVSWGSCLDRDDLCVVELAKVSDDQLARLCSKAPGGWGWSPGLGSGETLKLNIWRRKARWPNGSTAPGDTREGSGGAVLASEKAGSPFFWGGVHLPDHIFVVVILPLHFVGQADLSDPAHHWLMVSRHKKVSGAFCGVFYNQARPCDSHQSNPLNGPMTCFCGTIFFNRSLN